MVKVPITTKHVGMLIVHLVATSQYHCRDSAKFISPGFYAKWFIFSVAMFLPTIWSNPFFSFYSQYDYYLTNWTKRHLSSRMIARDVHCMWKFVHNYNYENMNNLYFNDELSLDHVIVSKFDYISRAAKKNLF